jgi:hypothetical protein
MASIGLSNYQWQRRNEMTQEEKVRNAVKVADELISINHLPQGDGVRMWQSVFSAMLIGPHPIFADNRTATGVLLADAMKQPDRPTTT